MRRLWRLDRGWKSLTGELREWLLWSAHEVRLLLGEKLSGSLHDVIRHEWVLRELYHVRGSVSTSFRVLVIIWAFDSL